MKYRNIGYLIGVIMMIEAALLVLPTAVSLIYRESVAPFLVTIAVLLILSLPFVVFKPKKLELYAKDGFVCASGSWIILSLFGALPFVFSGAIPNFANAFFETVSGFSTTGATILTEIEALPKGILFWRSFTHWIGGMGVIMLMLAITQSVGAQTIHVMRAEMPGPTKGKLVPKLRQTALILYGIYVGLSVLMVVTLLLCGLPLYDSLINMFSTAGTGGFSNLNDSIAGYNSPLVEWVIAVFMVVFGVNFNLYYFILIRRFKEIVRNEEFKVYIGILAIATAIVAFNIFSMFDGFGEAVRTSFFQVSAIISTTGFSTVNIEVLPALSKAVLALLMFIGACAGSTAGGLKLSRVMIIVKGTLANVRKLLRPNSVNVVKLNGEVVSDTTVRAATSYFSLYAIIIAVGTLIVSFDGLDITSNFTAVVTCINNVGPSFGEVGLAGNFSAYSDFSTVIFSLIMLFGRLEIIPMLVLFSPSTWRRR